MRDRRSPAVLLFPEVRALVKLSSKGRLIVREMKGWFHEEGYGFARDAVAKHAARKPDGVPVVSPIGNLVTVLDARTLAATFTAA